MVHLLLHIRQFEKSSVAWNINYLVLRHQYDYSGILHAMHHGHVLSKFSSWIEALYFGR